MILGPYGIYIKVVFVLLAAGALVGAGWHLGGLESKARLEESLAAQARTTADAVLAERASAQVEHDRDRNTERTHAQTIVRIDAAPAITTAVLVCGPDELRGRPLPGAQGQAGGVGTDPGGGGGQPDDRGRDHATDVRPAVEALKKRLERIMADYRQQDAEWPHGSSPTKREGK